jgi:hypothetical protein
MRKTRSFIAALSTIIILSLVWGCGDDTTVTPGNPPGTSNISGTITGYPGGSIIVKAKLTAGTPSDSFFAGTDTVDNDAMLNMNLSTPPANFLTAFDVSNLPPGVVISDTTVRAAQFSNLRAYGFSNELLGVILKKNYTDSIVAGSLSVQYLYSTKPFSVTGTDTNITGLDTTMYVYNVSFAAGWNAYILRLTEQRTNYTRYDFLSGDNTSATWRYEPSLTADRYRGLFK